MKATEQEKNDIISIFLLAGLPNEKALKFINQQDDKSWTYRGKSINSKKAVAKKYVEAIIAKVGGNDNLKKERASIQSAQIEHPLKNNSKVISTISIIENSKMSQFTSELILGGMQERTSKILALELEAVGWVDVHQRSIVNVSRDIHSAQEPVPGKCPYKEGR